MYNSFETTPMLIQGQKIMNLNKLNALDLIVKFNENNLFAAGTNCCELYDMVISVGYSWFTGDSINNCLIPE